jgi:hypothetical protein
LKNHFGAPEPLKGTNTGISWDNKLTKIVRRVLDNGIDFANHESLFH